LAASAARCSSCSRAWTTPGAGGVKLQYAEFDWTLNPK
jgi:hypothetical protein